MVSAVQKSYRKNILREMKGNASRMVSLFGIVALGVMMLTGLMSIAPSMRSAAQKYYVQQNVFDLRVLSTLGLSDQDIAAIAATPGVEAVMPVKTLDLEANWQGQEERMVVQLQALQQDPAADTDANMNRLVLRSGRMPQAADECVVHVMGYQAEIAEGTVLTLPEDTEGTKHKEYTVVGLVQDPQHISTDKESSTVGNGQLNYIAYVLDGELTADYYTACYIKAENAGQYDNYSQEYQEAVDQVADRLEQISTAQCVQRREQLMDIANQCGGLVVGTGDLSELALGWCRNLPRRNSSWTMPRSSWMTPRPSWTMVRPSWPSRKRTCPTPCRAERTSWWMGRPRCWSLRNNCSRSSCW